MSIPLFNPDSIAIAGALQFKITLSPLWIYGLIIIFILWGFLKQIYKKG